MLQRSDQKVKLSFPKRLRDLFGIEPVDSLVLPADRTQGIAIQKPDIFSAIADKLFAMSSDEGELEFAANIKNLRRRANDGNRNKGSHQKIRQENRR